MVPFLACEWISQWAAYMLSNWSFLEVLEYLGSFSVLIAVLFYFSESGNRVKQRHYQAWQVINTAQGNGGSGGRIEALQELNADKVPLVGVDVSSAFLQGLKLEHADLLRSDFSAADLRRSDLKDANFTSANLRSTNLRNSDLENVSFEGANLNDADLSGGNLSNTKFNDANLAGADLSSADLRNIEWKNLKDVTGANIYQVKNAPNGFIEWALQHGAVQTAGEN
jgi:uncharacterized protein YjbI with pentapeptide repeats